MRLVKCVFIKSRPLIRSIIYHVSIPTFNIMIFKFDDSYQLFLIAVYTNYNTIAVTIAPIQSRARKVTHYRIVLAYKKKSCPGPAWKDGEERQL